MKKVLKNNLGTILSLVIIVLFLVANNYLCCFVKVSGKSMYPTLKPDDMLVCVPVFKTENIKEQDIIVFRHDGKKLVKRVAFEPGTAIHDSLGGGICPENEFYVLGDNMEVSNDSRSFGTISSSSIQSRVLFRFPSFWIWIGLAVIVFVCVLLSGFSSRKKGES